MPVLFIHLLNSTFKSKDEGAEYSSPEAALQAGIRGALSVAADEILRGQSNSAVQLTIEDNNNTPVLRSVVSIAVSPMLPRI
jgi:hypothetical protein